MEPTKSCPVHGEIPLTLLCIHKNCRKPLCVKCIYDHCLEHENGKTFLKVKTVEQYRTEISEKLISCLKILYTELDNMLLEPSDMVLKKIYGMHDSALKVVDTFFKDIEEEAIKKMADAKGGPRIPDSSECRINLQNKISELEELNNKVLYENAHFLAALADREFDSEVKNIQFEISKEDKSIGIWTDESFEKNLRKLLENSIYVGKKLALSIPSNTKSSDIEVGKGVPLFLKKTGNSSNVGICLGSALFGGIHKFSVKIDKLSGPWVGLGFHANQNLNFTKSNYSTAICICSDQSFYNLQIINKEAITQGEVYHFEMNSGTGEITITSSNGLLCKATGHQNKTLYPFFEFNGNHEITILSYSHIL